jgi:cell division protein FtsW
MKKGQKDAKTAIKYPVQTCTGEIRDDMHILFPVLFLVGIGMVMVYSASSAVALTKFGSDYFFLRKQAMFAVIGIFALFVCRHIPFRIYWHLTYPVLIFSMVLLVVVHVPGIGYKAGGASRWIRIGAFTFQPSEFARLAMIFFMAYSLCKKQEKIREFSIGFVPHVLILAIFGILFHFQPDFGTIIIFSVIAWIMMFIGGVRLLHLATPLVLILPLLSYIMIKASYRLDRIMTFLDPWQFPQDGGYQVIHSLMAFGSGGLFGAGIGQGYQKLFYLPESHTDFIFSVIGEEIGLVGVIFIIALYVLIIWRGLMIAKNTEDFYGSLVAAGITTSFALQVCINMGVALGLLPTKGLTLPFLSYGGTSLLLNMAAIGILMNIGGTRH